MSVVVPREIQRFLKRYGGLNPYGRPKWRVIVSADRVVRESGVYRDWAEGLTNAEKGGLSFSPNPDIVGMNFQRNDNKPVRVVTEVRDVPKYPHCDGWILEVWFPATAYGSRDDWHSYKAVDGITPMLGPYPEEGDYEMQHGPWQKLPSTDVLQGYISSYAATITNRKGTPESRAQEYLLRYEYEQEQAYAKRKKEYEAMMRDQLTPMSSSSLAASRWRNQLAKDAGVSGHIGIL